MRKEGPGFLQVRRPPQISALCPFSFTPSPLVWAVLLGAGGAGSQEVGGPGASSERLFPISEEHLPAFYLAVWFMRH